MSKTDADLGTLSEHEGEWQVTFVRRLHHPIEKVWRALTEPEHMKAWFPDEMVGERRAGAPLKFVSEQMNETYEGEMLVFEPHVGDGAAVGADQQAPRRGAEPTATPPSSPSSRRSASWARPPATARAGTSAWSGSRPTSPAGSDLPGWGEVWKEIHPVYVEHFGPEASTIGPPEGWDPTAG